MASFSDLPQHLNSYYALEQHHMPDIKSRLAEVQAWQKNRMQQLHATLFSARDHQLMANYFLNRLYGGPDFPILAKQFERIVNYASKIERVAPSNVIDTAALGIELAVFALALDEQLAIQINTTHGTTTPITDAMVHAAYSATNQFDARLKQMEMLDQLSDRLDKYMRSLILYSAFKMARSTAQRKDFTPIYDFIAEAFAAMKPLKSTKAFVGNFTKTETSFLTQLRQSA